MSRHIWELWLCLEDYRVCEGVDYLPAWLCMLFICACLVLFFGVGMCVFLFMRVCMYVWSVCSVSRSEDHVRCHPSGPIHRLLRQVFLTSLEVTKCANLTGL